VGVLFWWGGGYGVDKQRPSRGQGGGEKEQRMAGEKGERLKESVSLFKHKR